VHNESRPGLLLSRVLDAAEGSSSEGKPMLTVLLVILVLMLLGAIPSWPHSRTWGYYPSGGLGLVLLVVVLLMLSGRL